MKKAFIVALALLCAAPAFAGGRRTGDLPQPRLLAPGDDVDLSGLEALEFRWSAEGTGADYYDFRLYRGHETIESGLIMTERVPRDRMFFRVTKETFEEGRTYAWSVRQAGARKSRPAYAVFKVVKK